jgi:hypothetical protein
MNIKEWSKAPKEKQGWKNYWFAKKHLWFGMIQHMRQERPGVRIVLHHLDWDDQHYEDWWPVVPMYIDDHISLHHTNKIVSEEAKEKNRKAHLGKKHSEESKIKCGLAAKKRISTQEWKDKISKAHKGRNITWADKIRETVINNHYKHTEEAKKKISASSLGRFWWNNGTIEILNKVCPEGFIAGRLKRR